jgi:phosphatidate cytidylyltransferase
MKDLGKRLPTTVVLVLFAYFSIEYIPPIYFSLLLFALISLAVYEFIRLANPLTHSPALICVNGLLIAGAFTFPVLRLQPVLAAILILNGVYFLVSINQPQRLEFFVRDMGVHFLTVAYLYFPLYFLLELKKMGPHFLFFLIAVIAIGDSGAYFVGSAVGKHKIYPLASPKKSLEGLLAAVATAALSGWLSILAFPVPVKPITAVWTAAIIGLFSQISDPVESLFKRAANRKDSGTLLPGHGGVLDRLDSYIFGAPLLYYLIDWFWK